MDVAELIGGVLVDATDPREAAVNLTRLVVAPRSDQAAIAAGFHPELVEVLRAKLRSDPDRIAAACQEGAAWVLGRRSIAPIEPWDLVASLPANTPMPQGLRRTTGETLIQLVAQARTTLRLIAPFMDRTGVLFLADAIAAATARGVMLEILLPTRSTHAADALTELRAAVALDGDVSRLRMSRLKEDAPWAHLKVLSADASSAYIGSANVTGAGMAGPNLELGILVRGPAVTTVERLLDVFRES